MEPPHPDYVVTEFRDLSEIRSLLPGSEVIGVSTHLSPAGLDSIARLLNTETLGLLTREAATIRYLSERVRRDAGFAGQIVATSSSDEGLDLSEFFRGVSLVAFTEAAARRVRAMRASLPATVRISVSLDQDSLDNVLDSLPTG